MSSYKKEKSWVNKGKDLIWKSNDAKIFGIAIDKDLKSDKHDLKLCSKATKNNMFFGMVNLLSFYKGRKTLKSF